MLLARGFLLRYMPQLLGGEMEFIVTRLLGSLTQTSFESKVK